MESHKENFVNLVGYPANGKHLEYIAELPYQIYKGEDGYTYEDSKGKTKPYNLFVDENKVDDRWIANIDENAVIQFEYYPKPHKDINVVLKHCLHHYKKYLNQELKHIVELEKLIKKDELEK